MYGPSEQDRSSVESAGAHTDVVLEAGQSHLIERPRLTSLLDESQARIMMLVAPAGYGKTTLARQWLRSRRH
ncbi:MAG: hypothetical protein C4305_05175, partial [Thermoleophilia bacterium]